MNMLPQDISNKIESHIGDIEKITSVSGGDINQAAKVKTKDSTYFLKWNTNQGKNFFKAEVEGLQLLSATEEIKTPKIISSDTTYLLLEWIETQRKTPQASYTFGQQLAKQHQHTSKFFGLDSDNFIGSLPQINTQESNWRKFYWEHRILPQLERAKEQSNAPEEILELFENFHQKLPALIPKNISASLLHGDLWGGNWIVGEKNNPIVIDPAVYYGHSEVDLAMTELFGGFSNEFYQGYTEIISIDKDYQNRKQIYQLYPLMVHWNLFGQTYKSQVVTILNKYL